MKKFISYEESLKKIEELSIKPLGEEEVFISDSLDRILAQDIVANENSPEYPTSSMDGYAIKHEDLKSKKIKILRDNPAGLDIEDEVQEGICIKTFTGSLMPKGSDTLIPIENVTVEDDYIIIDKEVPKSFAIREIGENYKKDEVLIKSGTKVGYAEISVMASLNKANVKVYKKPIVAVACTGNEILDVGEEQTNKAQIRSSNHYTIEALSKKYGADVLRLGIVKDDKTTITNAIKDALSKSDIVVTTGGVSVGDYDFVKDVVKDSLGADVVFQGVKIKPGQHILVAQKNKKIILALPGFAYSATVTFILYGLPIILKLLSKKGDLKIVDAILTEETLLKGNKTTFSSANLYNENAQYFVGFKNKKHGSSAIISNLLNNSAFIIQNEDEGIAQKGDKVKVIVV